MNKADIIEELKKSQKRIEDYENKEQQIIHPDVKLQKALQLKTEALDRVVVENNELKNQVMQSIEQPKQEFQTIVIPYVKALAQGSELLHAIRGWDKNMIENIQIVVIGDKEDWFANKLIHIPHTYSENNPPLDLIKKMKLAIDSELIPEEFIWTDDDIYPINALNMDDLKFLKCEGNLETNYPYKGGVYQTNKNRTYELLKNLKLESYNYDTHLPVVYEKSKVKELIERFNMEKEAYLFRPLYFNFFFPTLIPCELNLLTDNLKCGIYRNNPRMDIVRQSIHSKKFLNNGTEGYIPELINILNERFPDKCKFEV